MLGAAARLKRERVDRLDQARWAGFFAQVKISEHEKFAKRLTGDKAGQRPMSGAQIAAAMRAWAAKSG